MTSLYYTPSTPLHTSFGLVCMVHSAVVLKELLTVLHLVSEPVCVCLTTSSKSDPNPIIITIIVKLDGPFGFGFETALHVNCFICIYLC